MLVFRQKTGELCAILLDEGYLTDLRTGLAGAVVAKYLAPKNIRCIGIVGTGVQAKLQLQFLKEVVPCRKVVVWGRSEERLQEYCESMSEYRFDITTTMYMNAITDVCNLIVTTTPSQVPLLFANNIREGTHITAVGADSKEKQELDAEVFRLADIAVADSIDQCLDHGDSSHALKAGLLQRNDIIEIGTMILKPNLHRQNDGQITVADLTGVAIQDIQIAKYAYNRLLSLRDGSVA
jgi:ornithine cyclodeaminase